MKDFLTSLGAQLIVIFVAWLFLTICNWDWYPGDWNGFSLFILAIASTASFRVYIE